MTNSVEVSAAVPLWPVSYILVTACEGEVRFDDGATLSTDDLTVVHRLHLRLGLLPQTSTRDEDPADRLVLRWMRCLPQPELDTPIGQT